MRCMQTVHVGVGLDKPRFQPPSVDIQLLRNDLHTSNRHQQRIDTLALEMQLQQTATADRIEALVAAGRLPADMGGDLIESLHFFMGLSLKVGLDALDLGRQDGRAIDVAKLSSLDRDLLKDTLGVVKRFKAMLRTRLRLDLL